MASTFVYNRAKLRIADGSLDLDSASNLRIALLVGSAPADDPDLDSVAAVLATTYDRCSVGGYADATSIDLTAAVNDGANKADVTISGNVTFSALAAGQTILAALLYEFVTDDAGSFPIAHLLLTSTPTNGGDIVLSWAGNLVLDLT